MDPKKHLLISMWLIIWSTVAYYLPLMIYDLNTVDFESLPEQFYLFYCLFIAFNFSLVFMYAMALFLVMPSVHVSAKILTLWLVIAELSTLVEFVLRKYFLIVHHSEFQMWITLFVFMVCCGLLYFRSIMGRKTEKFDPEKTYIVKFRPKNILGIFNYIVNLKGHSGIYQDGLIYKFRRKSSMIESRKISRENMNSINATLESIGKKDLKRFIGKKFNLFSYNCNHFVKDANK